MSFKTACLGLTLALVTCATLSLAGQKKTAPGVLVQDKGKFDIKLAGQTVGHEEFEITPAEGGWLAKGSSDIKPPEGAPSKVTGSLTLLSNGSPMSYEWKAQSGKNSGAHIVFANGVARITLEMQGARPFQQDLSFNSPLIAVLDNNLYYQYAVLARIYDCPRAASKLFPCSSPRN